MSWSWRTWWSRTARQARGCGSSMTHPSARSQCSAPPGIRSLALCQAACAHLVHLILSNFRPPFCASLPVLCPPSPRCHPRPYHTLPQKDPGEYLLELQAFAAVQDPRLRRHKIDMHLRCVGGRQRVGRSRRTDEAEAAHQSLALPGSCSAPSHHSSAPGCRLPLWYPGRAPESPFTLPAASLAGCRRWDRALCHLAAAGEEHFAAALELARDKGLMRLLLQLQEGELPFLLVLVCLGGRCRAGVLGKRCPELSGWLAHPPCTALPACR